MEGERLRVHQSQLRSQPLCMEAAGPPFFLQPQTDLAGRGIDLRLLHSANGRKHALRLRFGEVPRRDEPSSAKTTAAPQIAPAVIPFCSRAWSCQGRVNFSERLKAPSSKTDAWLFGAGLRRPVPLSGSVFPPDTQSSPTWRGVTGFATEPQQPAWADRIVALKFEFLLKGGRRARYAML